MSNRPANDIDGVARREAGKRTFVAVLYTGINDSSALSIVGKRHPVNEVVNDDVCIDEYLHRKASCFSARASASISL